MENILQLLLPLIVVILTFVLGNRRRKTEQQRTPEAERQTDVPQDNEVALPPFMENFPFERDNFPDFLALEEAEPEPEPEPVVEEPVQPPAPEPPPTPPEPRTPVRTGTRAVPMTVLPDLSPQTFRQGIILSEILGRPKARRTRKT